MFLIESKENCYENYIEKYNIRKTEATDLKIIDNKRKGSF